MTSDRPEHTYTLTQRPFVDPFLIQGSLNETVTVTEPRTLVVKGSRLELLEEEPDLPVGEQVRVWHDRWFRCKAVKAEQAEAEEQARLEAESREWEARILQHAEMAYLQSANLVSGTDYPMSKARHFLNTYWEAVEHFREKHRFHNQFDDALMQRVAKEARITLSVLDRALAIMYADLVAKLNDRYQVSLVSAYAYSPREGGKNGHHSPGQTHLMLVESDLNQGRFKRHHGDALCKTNKHFWGLTATEATPSCRACIERLIKLLEAREDLA